MPTSASEETDTFRIVYYTWTGVSPGAGYIHTSAMMIEADLSTREMRSIMKSASQPNPMLSSSVGIYRQELARREPAVLSVQETAKLRRLILAWLNTNPPPVYHQYRALGREDAMTEHIILHRPGEESITVSIDPRKGFSPEDPMWPPPEWFALVDYLSLTLNPCVLQVPDGTLVPFNHE
ncbi:MAG TPA: hypothetical protein PK014_03945 [Thermoanaerobaculia bacterium]|nr:hypothetical protein [Thermoanaerobaculia bacterium]HUM29208.1 hypothetical protein [Thermoanaerobaculia bacterium]HXK67833.1 hypothetical protein [Thermoanaerobaculia bacterium]